MKHFALSFFFVFIALFSLKAQEQKPTPSLSIGLEQDILPYILKGYIITGWAGKNHLRARLSYAKAISPEFILQDGIQKDEVNAFGLSIEYFFKENFKGLWLGPGVGYWINHVDVNSVDPVQNESFIFSLGGGYNYFLTDWLYISPWVATHFRISGTTEIYTHGITYKPAVFTPEVSLKLGIKFPSGKK